MTVFVSWKNKSWCLSVAETWQEIKITSSRAIKEFSLKEERDTHVESNSKSGSKVTWVSGKMLGWSGDTPVTFSAPLEGHRKQPEGAQGVCPSPLPQHQGAHTLCDSEPVQVRPPRGLRRPLPLPCGSQAWTAENHGSWEFPSGVRA